MAQFPQGWVPGSSVADKILAQKLPILPYSLCCFQITHNTEFSERVTCAVAALYGDQQQENKACVFSPDELSNCLESMTGWIWSYSTGRQEGLTACLPLALLCTEVWQRLSPLSRGHRDQVREQVFQATQLCQLGSGPSWPTLEPWLACIKLLNFH